MSVVRAGALMQENAPKLVQVLAVLGTSLTLFAGLLGPYESVHINEGREHDSLFRLLALHRGDIIDKSKKRKVENGRQFVQFCIPFSVLKAVTLLAKVPGRSKDSKMFQLVA